MCSPKAATESDFAAAAALERLWSSEPWSEDGFRSFAKEENAALFVLREKDALIGYLALRFAADTGEIDTFAVAPQHRRRGAGSALLSHAIRFAGQMGVRELVLEVRASSLPARALYEKHGFRVCGTRKRFYKHPAEDAVLYRVDPEDHLENPGH